MIEYAGYKVAEPESIETPAMLIFEEQVDHNLRLQCELAGGGQHLMVHFKTHKCAAIARKHSIALLPEIRDPAGNGVVFLPG